MTSRPSLGVQQRQPQRSLSGSGIPQRPPPHQRTLSQQYLPTSPIRKEAFSDLNTSESSDGAQARTASFRRGGSRLKLELSHEPSEETTFTESPSALESSRAFTPSRIMPPSEPSELGDMSPQPSAHGDESGRLPMPKRRPRFAQPTVRADVPKAAPTTPAKKDARPKVWTVEVPAAAPRYSRRGKADARSKTGTSSSGSGADASLTGNADFFAWTGGHPEDQFSESVIRSGYFDKAPVSHTETSSAKAALFPMLKHKSGLHMLSSIFTGVLGQRRHTGQINPASTFKPPPRVTVTDSKREGWLKDLATPTIPIRRLSRTIPHGIRGKILLDQCLNKEIPTDRAVWLAKNVGANELRAFRRKGVTGAFVMGGETKWVRDWTVCVEQFLETRISAFTEDDWKPKVNYAIRLATNLYAEHLLDRDHYMDWLVSSLENSTQAKLPMWVLLVQIYLKDILSLRRHGRKLVSALLAHHAKIQNNPDKDLLEPLSSSISLLVFTILETTPQNFICPSIWPQYRDCLESSLPSDDDRLRAAFKHANSRNEHVAIDSVRTNPAARNVLVKLLDSTLQSPMSNELVAQCWSVSRDKPALVRTVLDWCTSLYRSGMAKVYVATRLLTTWSKLGVDVTTAILDFMGSEKPQERPRKKIVYHLVSELVRSGNFFVSRYVEWLIARGGLHEPADIEPEAACDTRLLVELPVHAMSESLRNLRASMLRRASYLVDDESQDFAMALGAIQHAVHFPFGHDVPMTGTKPMSISKLSKRISKSSRALKTEVAAWLRGSFCRMDRGPKREKGLEISASFFTAVRTMLESAEDYAMLADVLKVVSCMSDVDLLASCADTISLHLEVFAAVGVAQDLFTALLTRLKALVEEQGLAARPLLAALASLAPRLPGHGDLATQLNNDLVRSDRSTMVDACSPVSDNMAVRLQDSEGELHEEIEKLLMNGTSMDRNTMERLFGTVIERLQGCWAKTDDERQRAYALLLTRLRLFDAHHFDNLMSKWLCMLRTSVDRPSLQHVFPLLVSTGCLTLPLILASASDRGAASGKGPAGPVASVIVQSTWKTRYVQGVLQLMGLPLAHHPMLSDEECYRYSVIQSQAGKTYLSELLMLFRTALAEYSICKQQGCTDLPLDQPETLDRLLELIKSLAVMDSTLVSRALTAKSADAVVAGYLDALTTKLLIPTSTEGEHISFDKVLELTNEFTLPFCQLKLVASLGSGDSNNPDAAESHLEMFARAMDNAIEAKNITWTGMLSCLSPEITQHLKNRAQSRFFDVIPSLKSPVPPERTLEQSVQMAENLLAVIDAIVRDGSMGRPPQLIAAMADKLADMWEMLGAGDAVAAAGVRRAVVRHWLPLLLTFTTLHTATFDTSKASNEVRGRILLVFAGILQELDAAGVVGGEGDLEEERRLLSDRVFDLALVLADNLADETRMQCVRVLREATGDQRVQYLFSFAALPWEHLMLSHRDRPGAQQQQQQKAGGNNNISNAAGGQPTSTPPPAPPPPPRFMGMGIWGQQQPERLSKFVYRQWDVISDPNPNVGENDSSLNLSLFEAIKLQ